MAFLHRKLMMPDSNPFSNLAQACASVCHPPNNTQAALCTNKSCVAFCPLICPPPIFPNIFSSPSPPPPYIPKTHSKLSLTLKISIALLVTTFSIFILYTLYKFSILWFRSRRNPGQDQVEEETDADDFLHQDHGPVLDHPIWYIRTIGLQLSVISAITILKYKRGEGLVEGTDCSICLSEFQEDETLRLLPKCSHAFHIPCIDTWLTSHTNCPLCRAGIVKNGEPNLSLPVLVAESSGQLEETREGISENNGELERETEDGSSELRIESEDENDISKLEMGNSENSVRRSVSMDCLLAARISAEIAKAQPFQSDRYLGSKLDKGKQSNPGGVPTRVESSCSIARSLQKGPDFIKRSFSCGGKVLFSRQSR